MADTEKNPLDELDLEGGIPEVINLEEVEEASFEPLPPGFYNAEIENVETRTSQAGNPMLNVTFTITSDDYRNRKVFDNYVLNHPVGLSRLKALLKVVAPDAIKAFKPSEAAELMVGKAVRLKVSRRKGNDGQIRNNVQQVLAPVDSNPLDSLF